MIHGWRRLLFWGVVALVAAFVVFVLPFWFPPRIPVYSAAYMAGDNNRVASFDMALLGSIVALCCWWGRMGQPPDEVRQSLDTRWLGIALAAAVLFTGVFGWLVVRSHVFWSDAGYFYNQLRSGLVFHRTIYTGFEFPYGPGLYAWPAAFVVALGRLGVGPRTAYMVSVGGLQILGLMLLFYTLQALPMRKALKLAALLLMTLGFLTPLLSPNYSVFRFVLPFAFLVWLSRQTRLLPAMLIVFLGGIAQFVNSPEMGFAFIAGVLAYSAYRALIDGRRWLWLIVASAAGTGVFCLLAGPAYFIGVGRLSKGEYNLIVEPLPHILLFTITAVALAPVAVAGAVRARSRDAGMLLSIFVAALALIAPALGRCDPLHVFCNGLGLYMLAFVAVDTATLRWRRAWVFAFVLFVSLEQAVNFHSFQLLLPIVLRRAPPDPNEGIDVAAMQKVLGTSTVTAPLLAPPDVLDRLSAAGVYRPDYYCGMFTVWDAEAEAQKVREMRLAAYALVPTEPLHQTEPIDNTGIKRIKRFGLIYHQHNPPFYIGPPIYEELADHWTPVGRFGAYTLYRQNS